MSCTRGSPSWESRSRDTASYSYSPCCALVVDLMCHSSSGSPSARARPEFEFNRDLALAVRAALTGRGVTTLLVGADGSMTHLSQRTAAASRADFLLSVHHDSAQPQFFSTWDDQGTERLYSDR